MGKNGPRKTSGHKPVKKNQSKAKAQNKRDQKSLQGIKNAVGAFTKKPFGTAKKGRTRVHNIKAFDAFHPAHIALPRPVGPYIVMRTTQQVLFNKAFGIFGPMRYGGTLTGESYWSNAIGLAVNDLSDTITATNNMYRYVMDPLVDPAYNRASLVPAAFSIQMLSPGVPLNGQGILAVGRYRTMPYLDPAGGESAYTGSTLSNQFVSNNFPRQLSAPKLAFRGVQVDSVPFDMADLANFSERATTPAGDITLGTFSEYFAGFAPIGIANPSLATIHLNVSIEWRFRFSATNPAQATHRRYPTSSDAVWESLQRRMENMGAGVREIAEVVSNRGSF